MYVHRHRGFRGGEFVLSVSGIHESISGVLDFLSPLLSSRQSSGTKLVKNQAISN